MLCCGETNCSRQRRLDSSSSTIKDWSSERQGSTLPSIRPLGEYLPSILQNVEKSPHGIPFSPTAQTAKNVGFVITCMECEKPRLLHSKQVIKKDDLKSAKRMMQKVSYMCGAALSEYAGSGNDRDERHLKTIYVRENIACTSKIELLYYSVEKYPVVCIYCGIGGTYIEH